MQYRQGITEEASRNSQVIIAGLFEKRQNNKWSQYNYLKDNKINVTLDNNPATMHHKVFIIDNRTVITGSYNPTKNANNNNYENILILHNEKIAEIFLEEFNSIYP